MGKGLWAMGEGIEKVDVRGMWARVLFGGWVLLTSILFLVNYRAYLSPEMIRIIRKGHALHVAGFFMGSFLAWLAFTRGSRVKTVIVCAGLFAMGAVLETCQLLVSYRVFSLRDILANGVGIVGFLICSAVFEIFREGVRALERNAVKGG
jgi:VanZ family protein